MSLPHSRDPWSRLTTAAREVGGERDETAPYGFATRVVALAMAQERRAVSLLERFAFRAVAVASLLAVASVAFNYSEISVPQTTTAMAVAEKIEPAAADDTVALVLEIAD